MKRFSSSLFAAIFLFFAVSPSVFAASDAWQIGDGFMVFKENADKSAVNVGIGIGLPTEKLHVDGNGKFSGKMAIGGYDIDANYFLTTPSLFAGKGEFGELCIGSGTGTDCKTSWNQIVSAGGGILTETDPKLFEKNLDKVTVTSDGKMGIGTVTPNAKLEVSSDGHTHMRINTNFPGYNSTGIALGVPGQDKAFMNYLENNIIMNLGTLVDAPVALFTNNTEKFRISGNGNVGIGTKTPTNKLEISDSANNYVKINTTTATNNSGLYLTTNNINGYYLSNVGGINNDFYLWDGASDPYFTVKRVNGNVGIGKAHASEKLEIAGNIKLSGTLKSSAPEMKCPAGKTLSGFDANGIVCETAAAVVPVWQ